MLSMVAALAPTVTLAFLLLSSTGIAAVSCFSLLSYDKQVSYPNKAELERLFATRDNLPEDQARKFEEKVLLPKFVGLARKWANDMAATYYQIPREDIQQAALLGLVEAIRNYKANSDFMFSTVAHTFIRARMLEAVGSLYPGAAKVKDFYIFSRVSRLEFELKEKLKRQPTAQEILKENERRELSDLTLETVQDTLAWRRHLNSIETERTVHKRIDGDESGRTFTVNSLDLARAPGLSVEDLVTIRQFENIVIQKMHQSLKSDSPTVRTDRLEILLDYLGLEIVQEKDGRFHFLVTEAKTLEAIARSKGITRNRVQLIVEDLRRKIIRSLNDLDFKLFFDELFKFRNREQTIDGMQP